MDFKEQFKIGDLIKINDKKDSGTFFATKILSIDYEKGFFIIKNIEKNIPLGESISAKREFRDIIFIFNTKVLGFAHKDENDIIVLKIPKEVNRVQRREFYRLPLNVGISLRDSHGNICLGESDDISGMGLSVELDSPLRLNENVKVTIPFTKDFIVEDIESVVKRVDKGSKLPYRYGINFDYIEDEAREKIVTYIFQVQKMLLKISKNM